MISLVIPPKDQVSRIVKMLADEYGTASNIKSRVNRYVLDYLSARTKHSNLAFFITKNLFKYSLLP